MLAVKQISLLLGELSEVLMMTVDCPHCPTYMPLIGMYGLTQGSIFDSKAITKVVGGK